MEKLGTSIRMFTRRLSRKGNYEPEGVNPRFQLKALSKGKGMRVFGTEPLHARQAVHQMVDLCGQGKGVNTTLVLAGRDGVLLLDKTDRLLLSYAIQEIVICFVDQLYEDVFVFMGDQGGEIRCHAFRCGTLERAQLICLAMAKMFQVHYTACSSTNCTSNVHQDWTLYVQSLGLSTARSGGRPAHKSKETWVAGRRSLVEKPTYVAEPLHEKKRRFSEQTQLSSNTSKTSCKYIFVEDDNENMLFGSPDSVEGIGEWGVDSDGEFLISN